jgi:uncharacterized repeat protein (TIGR03847 family)
MEDFGAAEAIDAEAIGEPGQRTFRLMVRGQGGYAALWMEKEQLKALADAAREICERIGEDSAAGGSGEVGIDVFPLGPEVEFRVGRLAIGFDHQRDLLVVLAHSMESEEGDEPDFVCGITRRQALEIAEKIDVIYVSGRPACPLCGLPLDPGGHRCVKTNGHRPELDERLSLDDNDENDES